MIGRVSAVAVLTLNVLLASGLDFDAGRPITDITDVLDAYVRGVYDAAIQSAVGLGAVDSIRQAIERSAGAWIEKQGSASAPRRRIVVASFVIDFARARYSAIQLKTGIEVFQNPTSHGQKDTVEREWNELRPMHAGGRI